MRKMSPSLRKQQLQYLSLVLPGMIIFTIGLIVPMFLSFYYSLTSWNGHGSILFSATVKTVFP